jgi:predicted N-formylglutamate amidohydrolase
LSRAGADGGGTKVILSCEHGGNRVPEEYRALFDDAEETLASHRGWDAGALPLARRLARLLDAPLHVATVSRLVVELNRSPRHPRLFSEWTRALGRDERRDLLLRYYEPYRDELDREVTAVVAAGYRVVHLGVHTFTPALNGRPRRADVALLYDPARPAERALVASWTGVLSASLPDLAVRRNQPYRGASDGLTTWLRKRHGEGYLGIELEVNQRLLGPGGRFPRRIGDAVVAGLRRALEGRAVSP